METINNGDPLIAMKIKEGILFVASKKDTAELIDKCVFLTKIFLIEENIFCVITGSNPDAFVLIEHARVQAQYFKQNFKDIIPLKRILDIICEIKQKFTQTGKKRPFGASLLIGGFDAINGFQIFRTEPSGNFSEWKAVAVGINSQENQTILNQEYEDQMSLSQSLKTIIRIFAKKIRFANLSKKIEILILRTDDKRKVILNSLTHHEIDSLIKK